MLLLSWVLLLVLVVVVVVVVLVLLLLLLLRSYLAPLGVVLHEDVLLLTDQVAQPACTGSTTTTRRERERP